LTRSKFVFILIALCLPAFLHASEIRFSGGYTRVSLQDSDRQIELSGGAAASTDSISIEAGKILLYGPDYRYVDCTGGVNAQEKEHSLAISAADIFYDREEGYLLSDGWIEIEDTENEAQLSGSWFEYSLETRMMILQMQASISKVTQRGLLVCTAHSIEYNAGQQTLSLRGNASVTWGSDSYRAAHITVNIETEEVILQGSISGEING